MNSNFYVYPHQSGVKLTAENTTNTTKATVAGSFSWVIVIPASFSGHSGLTVQVNYENEFTYWQPPVMAIGNPNDRGDNFPVNQSFSAGWIDIGSITAGQTIYHSYLPARYIRLVGSFTGAASASYSYVWTTNTAQGV